MSGEREISEVTRRAIIDHLTVSGTVWAGRLPEDDFLARLYNLRELHSTDHRFRNAAGDIQQHRNNWHDWPDDWIFYDDRFELLHGRDEVFLKFLAETIHPVIRPDLAEVRDLAGVYNTHLKADGWTLIERGTISGKPIFVPSRLGARAAAFEEPTGWQKVDRQLQEAHLRLDTGTNEEHFQAVGLLCREVLISVAQEVFKPELHRAADGTAPSSTDAGRMLEAFFSSELAGGSNEEVRTHGKASLKLALALQHQRHAEFRTAALCLEGTASVVNLVAILAGRRG